MQTLCCRCHKEVQPNAVWYGLHSHCFTDCFNEKLLEFSDLAIRSSSQPLQKKRLFNSSFFQGKFRKYSARLGDTHYILKVEQQEYPELPATEFLCNQIFESLGIEVPPYHLIRFPAQSFCFATKNFMTDKESSATLDHIYHFMTPEMRYDCETLVKIIGLRTGRRTEQEKFVFLTLADSLIGNNDRHGRNLAFVNSSQGIHLSPFYDNPSALSVEIHSLLDADLQPRGAIFTKESIEPTMKDYILEWKRLGYANVIDRFRQSIATSALKKHLEFRFMTEKRRNALKRLMEKRTEEIFNG